MTQQAPIFEEIITNYLKEVDALPDADRRSAMLEISGRGGVYRIPYFDRLYTVGKGNILDQDLHQPSHATRVLLCKYLLLCPEKPVADPTLVTYKDFADAAPFVGGFASMVKQPIALAFTGKLSLLAERCLALGGQPAATGVACDFAMRFQPLPRVPIILLYNDADADFPAQATLLFQRDAAHYLDMECLAMIGGTLAHRLQSH